MKPTCMSLHHICGGRGRTPIPSGSSLARVTPCLCCPALGIEFVAVIRLRCPKDVCLVAGFVAGVVFGVHEHRGSAHISGPDLLRAQNRWNKASSGAQLTKGGGAHKEPREEGGGLPEREEGYRTAAS